MPSHDGCHPFFARGSDVVVRSVLAAICVVEHLFLRWSLLMFHFQFGPCLVHPKSKKFLKFPVTSKKH